MNNLYLKALLPVLLLSAVQSRVAHAQSISGVVNSYYHVTAINVVTNTVTVSSSAGLSPGTRVLIIQMKGASCDNSTGSSFGNITAINNAGNYEYNTVCSVVGNDVLLKYSMLKTYTVSGLVQLVTIPQYSAVTITDTLKATPWNAAQGTGGVIAIQASSSITLSAPIDADGAGFKGGSYIDYASPAYTCDWSTPISNYYLANPPSSSTAHGGLKGEGISIVTSSMEAGRGKIANGGGGGNNHNAGGAGGSNIAAGGSGGERSGEGGFNCHGVYPGIGGLSLSSYGYTLGNNRIFLGGGGGSGHGNNNVGMPGANGGGIIFLITDVIYGNSSLVRANGARPYRSDLADPYEAGGDAGGGGGAGGAVIISANSFVGNLNVEANGGRGSNAGNAPSTGSCYGPGGGGGGGVIWVKGASVSPSLITSVTGGDNGVNSSNASVVACRGLANNATPGSNGSVLANYTLPASIAIVCVPLAAGDLIYFTSKMAGREVELIWKMREAGEVVKYEVERSADQVNYTPFATIANNNKLINSVKDQAAGALYYRLKIYYKDGSIAYSQVIAVDPGPNFSLEMVKINPNPVKNILYLSIKSRETSLLQITILDPAGRIVQRKKSFIQKGINELSLQMEELPAGTYLMALQNGKDKTVCKIIKRL